MGLTTSEYLLWSTRNVFFNEDLIKWQLLCSSVWIKLKSPRILVPYHLKLLEVLSENPITQIQEVGIHMFSESAWLPVFWRWDQHPWRIQGWLLAPSQWTCDSPMPGWCGVVRSSPLQKGADSKQPVFFSFKKSIDREQGNMKNIFSSKPPCLLSRIKQKPSKMAAPSIPLPLFLDSDGKLNC